MQSRSLNCKIFVVNGHPILPISSLYMDKQGRRKSCPYLCFGINYLKTLNVTWRIYADSGLYTMSGGGVGVEAICWPRYAKRSLNGLGPRGHSLMWSVHAERSQVVCHTKRRITHILVRYILVKTAQVLYSNPSLSPPVLMHVWLLCITFCLSVCIKNSD